MSPNEPETSPDAYGMRSPTPTWCCTPATGWNRRCSTRSKHRSKRLVACWGNNDGAELRRRLPERADATLGGLRFTVVHETGAATGREARMAHEYPDTDVLVFGHSHIPWDTTANDRPAPAQPGFADRPAAATVLHVHDRHRRGRRTVRCRAAQPGTTCLTARPG